MVEPEIVRQIRTLAGRGWGAKRIAQELGLARNTVRRYVRGGDAALVQTRPGRRALDEVTRTEAVRLFDEVAEGNAVVVADILRERGVVVGPRVVQRVVAGRRREKRAADVASVRYETAPGQQMQIDFGQKLVVIGGVAVVVHLLIAVLSHSRRVFAKAFLAERQDEWREGIAAAFRHFGGVVRVLLGDNSRCLVVQHDRRAGVVTFHPAYVAFCRDWDVEPRACAPYRARTKGKTEAGVKYVKRNALAGRSFESFAALEQHLAAWCLHSDERVHGTTHERPRERFERDERAALKPLPARPLPARLQRLARRVAHDALVDVDTVRYSVPHRLVRDRVEVELGDDLVRVFHDGGLVATHRRSFEPYTRIVDPEHWKGLWRPAAAAGHASSVAAAPSTLEAMGRSLADYAAIVEGGAA